jgi:hypothetical protein
VVYLVLVISALLSLLWVGRWQDRRLHRRGYKQALSKHCIGRKRFRFRSIVHLCTRPALHGSQVLYLLRNIVFCFKFCVLCFVFCVLILRFAFCVLCFTVCVLRFGILIFCCTVNLPSYVDRLNPLSCGNHDIDILSTKRLQMHTHAQNCSEGSNDILFISNWNFAGETWPTFYIKVCLIKLFL